MIRKNLPKQVSDAWENFMHFRPFDWMGGIQAPPTRFEIKDAEHIKGYLYPAPGSRPKALVPDREVGTDIYDTSHYKRDAARAPRRVQQLYPAKYALQAGESTPVIGAGPNEAVERGSPAERLNPAVAKYDETGLRHAMSASHVELEKNLVHHMADHLPLTDWDRPILPTDVTEETPMPHRTAKDIKAYSLENKVPPLPGFPARHAGVHGLFMPTDVETYEGGVQV